MLTGKVDRNGIEIKEGDVLVNEISGYEYTVRYGEHTIPYTKPFPLKCLGFYIEYLQEDKIEVDSFAMLTLSNLRIK